jgi:threonine dehydratase
MQPPQIEKGQGQVTLNQLREKREKGLGGLVVRAGVGGLAKRLAPSLQYRAPKIWRIT